MSSHKLKPQHQVTPPQVVQQAMRKTEVIQRSGPLPDPQELAGFGQISPDFPERIMRMAESEQQHRFEVQKNEQVRADYTARANSRCVFSGQIVALLVVAMVMTATVFCAKYGQPWPASLLGGGGLAAIIATIIYGSRLKRQQ